MPDWFHLLLANLAFDAYVVAILCRLLASRGEGIYRAFRVAWLAAAMLLALHAGMAFATVHNWSHIAAYEHTARRTAEVTGWESGIGLYLNEAMIVVWLADAIWAIAAPDAYLSRPAAFEWTIHSFFGFMFFCATVVFGSTAARVKGLIACLAVGFGVYRFVLNRREEENADAEKVG